MLDSRLSLAISMYSNPGVYALLIGSGVSRGAEIPTGWEVTLDLIDKIAVAYGEDRVEDPAAWFEGTFGEPPTYSRLLEELTASSTERQELLREYFEPTPEEAEEGKKRPTHAHQAIARLVDAGYVQVLITTNFDRLLEHSLEERGITPTVIHSPELAEGAAPLAHNDCTLLKVHGDYLDTRIKNTAGELEEYTEPIDALLDQIFDEYGLIVCGWSAEYDFALRRALERCRSRRYRTYWTDVSEPAEEAKALIEQLDADFIEIDGAESFFPDLEERVTALEERDRPHPLSVSTAITTIKRYMADSSQAIRLYDTVQDEAEEVLNKLSAENISQETEFSEETLARRVEKYEDATELLRSMFAAGCRWEDGDTSDTWTDALQRVANLPTTHDGGLRGFRQLMDLPALMVAYAGGIAAITGRKYETVARLFMKPRVRRVGEDTGALVRHISAQGMFRLETARMLPGMEKRYTPMSDYLHQVLRDTLKSFVREAPEYDRFFDLFEYLWGLQHAHLSGRWYKEDKLSGPTGRFTWRWNGGNRDDYEEVTEWITGAGEDWPLLRAGLFDGDLDRLREVRDGFDRHWKAVAAKQF